MLISQKTLNYIHEQYNIAAEQSTSLLEIINNLFENLQQNKPLMNQTDNKIYQIFLNGLYDCLKYREKTFEITEFMTDINFTIMLIIKYLNERHNINIDINWFARRKALESELTKILNIACSLNNDSIEIRDRFGLRGVFLNNNIDQIYILNDAITNILAKSISYEKKSFIKWLDEKKLSSFIKTKAHMILETAFTISNIKDYIKDPKPNGYKTLQNTVTIPPYSNILPGVKFELQLRTNEMHEYAENGSASHTNYKNQIDKAIRNVFHIDDCTILHLNGFKNYDEWYKDHDGLHYPKHFADRRST